MGNCNGYAFELTKIRRLSDGRLVGAAGSAALGQSMFEWIEAGADPAKFPPEQRDKDDWDTVLVIVPDGKLLRYERMPYPIEMEVPFTATGSGRDYALMAMRLGKTAVEAVQLASEFDPNTGPKVDTLVIEKLLNTKAVVEVRKDHSLRGGMLGVQHQFFQR